MQETIEHRVIRCKNYDKDSVTQLQDSVLIEELEDIKLFKKEEMDLDVVNCDDDSSSQTGLFLRKSTLAEKPNKNTNKTKVDVSATILPEFPYIPRKPTEYYCESLEMPKFLYGLGQRVQAVNRRI